MAKVGCSRSIHQNSNHIRSSCLRFFAAVLLGSGAMAADWPNPENANDLSGGSTPKNTVRAIEADQPYNSDQNTMDFTYHVEQRNDKTYFYATLKSRIEISTSGTQVYNMFGF